jgi:hypothetical protein
MKARRTDDSDNIQQATIPTLATPKGLKYDLRILLQTRCYGKYLREVVYDSTAPGVEVA